MATFRIRRQTLHRYAGGAAGCLILDEVYSVEWSGVRLKIKKSAGTALKFFGTQLGLNLITYAILIGLSLLTLSDAGIIGQPDAPNVPFWRRTAESPESTPTEMLDWDPGPEGPLVLPSDVGDQQAGSGAGFVR